jgi:hypothetical protein
MIAQVVLPFLFRVYFDILGGLYVVFIQSDLGYIHQRLNI